MSQQNPTVPYYGANYQNAPPYSSFFPNVSQASQPMFAYHQSMIHTHNQQAPIAQANDLRLSVNTQAAAQNGLTQRNSPSINPDFPKPFPPPVIHPHSAHFTGMPPAVGQQSSTSIFGGLQPEHHKPPRQIFPAASSDPTGSQSTQYGRNETIQQIAPPEPDNPYTYYGDRVVQAYPRREFQVNETNSALPIQGWDVGSTKPDKDGPNAEPKEKVKAAVLELSSYNITYDELVAEGLDSGVLRSLFAELGLDLNTRKQSVLPSNITPSDAHITASQSDEIAALRDQKAIATVVAKHQGANSLAASTTSGSGMERKDKIAQLLAAKAARSGTAGIISPSASPASALDSAMQQRTMKNRFDQTANESISNQLAEQQSAVPARTAEHIERHRAQAQDVPGVSLQGMSELTLRGDAVYSLPTPTREPRAQSDLSSRIPGLSFFEDVEKKKDSADGQINLQPSNTLRYLSANDTNSVTPNAAGEIGRKSESATERALEGTATPGEQAARAQTDMNHSESGEPSEGEIFEDDSAANNGKESRLYPIQTAESSVNGYEKNANSHPHQQEFSVAMDDKEPPTSKLKREQFERAAQLKADLLRRLRAKQLPIEGKPLLNDEVTRSQQHIERSKAELVEARGDLQKHEAEVQKHEAEIQKHKAEAARAQERERRILEEIQRMEIQLAEGMSGQKRLSTERDVIRSRDVQTSPSMQELPELLVQSNAQSTDESASAMVIEPTPPIMQDKEQEVIPLTRILQDPSIHNSAYDGDDDGQRTDENTRNQSDAESYGSASMSDSRSERSEDSEPDNVEDDDEEYDHEDTKMDLSQSRENSAEYEPSDTIYPDVRNDLPGDHQTQSNGSHQSSDEPERVEAPVQLPSINPGVETNVSAVSQYTIYKSPMSFFKKYRTHPSFNDQVKGGYRSLTFSNKIDPGAPICTTELLTNSCHDPHCQEQHFRSMVLTDDIILKQLSSADDISDIALRAEYVLGLKQLITSLKEKAVKGFFEVADAVARRRRDWDAAHLEV